MHIQHAPVSTPNALRQVGKLFRELSHVYFPFIWAKTHRRDLRDSSKERWQDSGDVLAPIFSRPNREIADRRMMFPCIHGSISFSKCFWESSRRLASDAIGALLSRMGAFSCSFSRQGSRCGSGAKRTRSTLRR